MALLMLPAHTPRLGALRLRHARIKSVRSLRFMFLNNADLVEDAVKKYYRILPNSSLVRALTIEYWLPDLGSNRGPAD